MALSAKKWGVRRYQNKDGSLTPAGKKRNKMQSDNSFANDFINHPAIKTLAYTNYMKAVDNYVQYYSNTPYGATFLNKAYVSLGAAFVKLHATKHYMDAMKKR